MSERKYRYYLVVDEGPVPTAIKKFIQMQNETDQRVLDFIDTYGCRSLAVDEFGNVKGVFFDEPPFVQEWTQHEDKKLGTYYVPNFDTEAGLKIDDELPQTVPSAETFAKMAGLSHLVVKNELGSFIRQCGFRHYGGHLVVLQPVDGKREATIADKTGLLEVGEEELRALGINI